jgi:hypothetical protein
MGHCHSGSGYILPPTHPDNYRKDYKPEYRLKTVKEIDPSKYKNKENGSLWKYILSTFRRK